MVEIEKPRIECIEKPGDNSYGKCVVEPLERGYGTTLGNSLRRILLSSLPGTAVTSIKIAGVQHEFSSIPGVKEDVTEIVLNVKGIIAKLYSEGTKTVYIEASGEGVVTAGDIKADSEVEILNPEHPIATLGPEAVLNMELTLSHGRGYVPADRNKTPQTVIGVIPVDSVYTPVKKVNYTVENTRVKDLTDFDKLTLEVWTDGTIAARDAVSLGGTHPVRSLYALYRPQRDDGQQVHGRGEVPGHPRQGPGNDHRGTGSVGQKLQLPQACQHQHRRRSDLQDGRRDDEGTELGPEVSGRSYQQTGHDGTLSGQRRQLTEVRVFRTITYRRELNQHVR